MVTMKDFRNSPYKHNSNYKVNDTSHSSSSGFFKFLMIVLVIGIGLYFYFSFNSGSDQNGDNTTSSPTPSFSENFSSFMEEFKEVWNEMEESSAQPQVSSDPNTEEENSSPQNIELKASIVEKNIFRNYTGENKNHCKF